MSADGEKFSALLVLFSNANNGRNDEQFYKNKKEKKKLFIYGRVYTTFDLRVLQNTSNMINVYLRVRTCIGKISI